MKQPKQIYVNAKGEITIPVALRKKYEIKNGTRFIVTDAGNEIILKPITELYLKRLQGSLKGQGGLRTLIREREKGK